jgi:hypothetical protein
MIMGKKVKQRHMNSKPFAPLCVSIIDVDDNVLIYDTHSFGRTPTTKLDNTALTNHTPLSDDELQ